MEEFLSEYWPTVVGIPLLVGAGIAFFAMGGEEEVIASEGRPGALQETTPQGPPPPPPPPKQQFERPARGEDWKAPEGMKGDTEYREYLYAVEVPNEDPLREHKTDDPEVQATLSQVSVQMYATSTCSVCSQARSYFDANNVRYSEIDVEASTMNREKLRRVSGGSSVPVIVVDGRVMRGFSPSSMQAALTKAVKLRIEKRR